MNARFQCNPSKVYKIAEGATFTSVMGEELDSGSIILPQVLYEDRLVNLTPYSYVRVNGVLYLVDDFVETEIDLKNHIYSYTIDLMSETKLLEKIQLPNKTFTHSLTKGSKTLTQAIRDLIYCYVPYVKVEKKTAYNWQYEQLFVLDESDVPSIFTKTKVKDMSMSKPTLRQAITSISTQVGYLPYLKERKLKFLKLGDNGVEFNKVSLLSVSRSMASDSFLTSLQCINDNLLDQEHVARSEIIGFRDRDNAILKQKENCFITTDLPIYEVKKLTCGFYIRVKSLELKKRTSKNNDDGSALTYDSSTKKYTMKLNYSSDIVENKIYDLHYFDDMNMPDYEYFKYKSVSNVVVKHLEYSNGGYNVYSEENLNISSLTGSADIEMKKDAIVITYDLTYHYKYVCAKSTYGGATGEDHKEYDEDRSMVCCMFAYGSANINSATFTDLQYAISGIDITPLVYEKNKRKLLSVDYTNIEDNIESMSKNYYTTLEYEIGDNTIKGFSNSWSLAMLWWETEHTLGEQLVKVITKSSNYSIDIENKFGGIPSECVSNIDYEKQISEDKYTSMFFSIEYLPLNTLNIKFDKDNKDEIIPLMQLDTQSSGFTSVDDLTLAEKDNINRFSNNMLVISQRLIDLSEISEIGNLYDNSIIFKREIAYHNDYYLVRYYASEDYVIKNYSTSIATTYRAYQNVDYSQSVERVENKKAYLLIAPYFINANRNIYIYNLSDFFLNYESEPYINAINFMDSNYYRYDLSVVSSGSSIIFNYNERDNVSAGVHISSNGYSDKLGGLLQEYYMISDTYLYNDETNIFLGPALDLSNQVGYQYSDDELYDAPAFIEPKVPNTVHKKIVNNGMKIVMSTYRDLSERFVFTIQLEYYVSDKSLIQFSSWLAKTAPVVAKQDEEYRAILQFSKPEEDINDYEVSDIEYDDTYELSHYVSSIEHNNYYAKIKFFRKYNEPEVCWIRVLYYNKEDKKLYEVIRFNLVNDEYYLSINDTKTLKLLNYDDYDVPSNEYSLNVNDLARQREV